MPANPVVYIEVVPLLKLANDYSQKINITHLSKLTTVISITLFDAVQQRAKDFINRLIKKYNKDGIDEKNQVSNNTAKFIDKRLELIKEELNNV